MSDSYIQVALDSNGKKLQTFLNEISGQDVHAEAVTICGPDGSPISTIFNPSANQLDVFATINPSGGALNVQNLSLPSNFLTQTSIPEGNDITAGVTTGAAVITDANGTLQQYLRGLVKLAAQRGAINLRITHVTSSGSAASLAVARDTRRGVLFTNNSDSGTVSVGTGGGLTFGDGQILGPLQSCPFSWVGEYFVVDDGATSCDVTVADEYD